MRKLSTMTVVVLTIALFSSPALACELPNLTEKVMIKVAKAVGAQVEQLDRVEISTSQGVLAHYTAILKVGDGEYDKIGVHRVVRESLPGVPVKTKAGIMCIHGDIASFNLVYMPTTLPDPSGSGFTIGEIIGNPDHSLGIYLADKGGMDVWGIDLRWSLIPPQGTLEEAMYNPGPDLNDMDTATHLADITLSLKFARLTRLFTAASFDKMFVTGWSRGAYLTVALANEQAILPKFKRDIKGIIPVDFAFKTNKDAIIDWACCAAQSYTDIPYGEFRDMLGNLVDPFANKKGLLFTMSAALASTDPDGDTPLFPPLTTEYGTYVYLKNSEVFDLFFGATWFPWNINLRCPGLVDFHFSAVAPQMNVGPGEYIVPGFLKNPFPMPMPVMAPERDMLFTDRLYMLLLSFHISPYQSYGEQRDSKTVMGDCGEDLPYDDNLSKIKVPVLYVGTAGGMEAMGNAEYTLGLLGTPEGKKALLEVQLQPNEYANMDFGHADLYFGNKKIDPDDGESLTYAETYLWIPMLNWIENNLN